MEGVKNMELGQAVDFCIEWNKVHKDEIEDQNGKETKHGTRKATQADWNAFLG